jgi:delta-aminolevulinic acid dehydratase/porphobilinogen synthase
VIRNMVRENIVLPSNFIYPLFIHDEVGMTLISSCRSQTPSAVVYSVCLIIFFRATSSEPRFIGQHH